VVVDDLLAHFQDALVGLHVLVEVVELTRGIHQSQLEIGIKQYYFSSLDECSSIVGITYPDLDPVVLRNVNLEPVFIQLTANP
jgi:hypothetical protein